MSFIENYLDLAQALELKNLNKKNKDLVSLTLANNKEFKNIQSKLEKQTEISKSIAKESNKIQNEILFQQKLNGDTNDEILENQRQEIKNFEIQNNLKAKIFKINLLVDSTDHIEDFDVLNYFISNNLDYIKSILYNATNALFEISDKEYCNNLKKKIDAKFTVNQTQYKNTLLSDFDLKLNEYNEIIISEKKLNIIVRDEAVKKGKDQEQKSSDYKEKTELNFSKLNTRKQKITSSITYSKFYKIFRILVFTFSMLLGIIMLATPSDKIQGYNSAILFVAIFFFGIASLCIFLEFRHRKIKRSRLEEIKKIDELIKSTPKQTVFEITESENKQKLDEIRILSDTKKIELAKLIEKIKIKYPEFFQLQTKVSELKN